MTLRTRTRAPRDLASLLKQAAKEGQVRIKDKNGQTFVIRPEKKKSSPLDVEGVDLGMTTQEIVGFIHKGRRLDVNSRAKNWREQ